jgi:hypothetical protein
MGIKHRENTLYNKTAVGQTAIVSNLKKGFYNVTLTITDDTGATGSDGMTFTATGDPIQIVDVDGNGKSVLEESVHILRIFSGHE